MLFQHVGEVMDVYHRLLDARFFQAVENMIDERAAGEGDERLWPRIREGAHARSLARRHDHCAFDLHERTGICLSSQARKSARTGCARFRSR